jgi:thiol-disulfide isomerase/thioredoxin
MLLAVLVAVVAPAQIKTDNPPASLKVGDPAPALKVDKWNQGEAVPKFERGQVYVVEFWATWCGPCIAFMPDLAELQRRYRDRGVTCIGFTARDLLGAPGNTEEKVAAFVKRRGPKLAYRFAYADDPAAADAWLKAAGRSAIPCVFVVDKAGRVAYIGDPTYLELVLPLVLTGDARAEAVGAKMARIQEEFLAVNKSLFPDHRAGLKALKEFEANYPALTNNRYGVRIKLSLLPKVGEVAEAKKVAQAVIARATKEGNPSALMQVSALLRLGAGKESKELLAVAVKAAEAAVRVAGDREARALIELAATYHQAGDSERAGEFARRAVAAAADEPAGVRQAIVQEAKRLSDGNGQGKE